MTSTVQITPTNTFASQSGSIPLSQLDTNFTQITSFLNNPNNYANYLVDSGTANTYVVTFPTGVIPASYTAGLSVVMKVTNSNTGASTVNVNGLGAKNIYKQGSTTVTAGDLIANAVVLLVYDGTQFQVISGGSGAVAGGVLYENSTTISTSYTITTNKNAHSVGPITLASGVTLTVPTGSRYVVL